VLSFGEHGTFKGCNGLQMAFNSAQDLDEIRIEQGTYECNGLLIPKSKTFEHGIKVSGGWDSGFVSQSDDPAVTVFDGKEEGRILTVNNKNGSVAIEGLSFQNGKVSGLGRNGGAIDVSYRVVSSITNCIFTNNTAHEGGAVYNVVTITNSTFTNNSAFDGGAAFRNGSLDRANIINSTFTNNSAYIDGGAVRFYADITNCTFTNNSARNGGAVSSSSFITNSTFTNNTASGNGGAVSSSYSITNSTFTNNSAYYGSGGAVSSSYSSSITNSTFTNNSASKGGAVSYVDTITNSTFTNNSASENGGGFYGKGTILNSIFAQNKVGEEANDITPYEDLHVDYTLANYISGAVDLGTHIIMGEPRFVDAENGNFRLRTDSPAIDVGDSSVITACSKYDNCDYSCQSNCDDRNSEECKKTCCSCKQYSYPFLLDDKGNALDLDGNSRLVGGAIDLGAYEVQ
jgi:predicted outer membrane repeat protein